MTLKAIRRRGTYVIALAARCVERERKQKQSENIPLSLERTKRLFAHTWQATHTHRQLNFCTHFNRSVFALIFTTFSSYWQLTLGSLISFTIIGELPLRNLNVCLEPMSAICTMKCEKKFKLKLNFWRVWTNHIYIFYAIDFNRLIITIVYDVVDQRLTMFWHNFIRNSFRHSQASVHDKQWITHAMCFYALLFYFITIIQHFTCLSKKWFVNWNAVIKSICIKCEISDPTPQHAYSIVLYTIPIILHER